MPGTPESMKGALKQSLERLEAMPPGEPPPENPEAPSTEPEPARKPEEKKETPAPPQEEGKQSKPEKTVTVEVNGKTVSMTESAYREFAEIGMLAGDKQSVENAWTMDKFLSQNPMAARAIRLIMEDPSKAETLLGETPEQSGQADATNEGSDIQALRAEIQALRQQVASGKPEESPEAKFHANVDTVAARFPALQSFPREILYDTVLARVNHRGETLSQAIMAVAASVTQTEVQKTQQLSEKERRVTNLQGVGPVKSTGMTSLSGPPKLAGKDLKGGGVRKAILKHWGI